MPEIWAGLDIGKKHHHAVVIDADGKRLVSRRVLNDETELLQLIGRAGAGSSPRLPACIGLAAVPAPAQPGWCEDALLLTGVTRGR